LAIKIYAVASTFSSFFLKEIAAEIKGNDLGDI
jgi:hypothetical protein